jgi:hypothetical protein
MEKHMVRVIIIGIRHKRSMMEIGIRDKDMDMVFGRIN